jgi:hypothetical protein
MELDPLKRISMKEALNDKYFDEVREKLKGMYKDVDQKRSLKRK